jgi:predicted metal-binding protein
LPSRKMAGVEAKKKRLYSPSYRKTFEIVSKVESEAFYDGYYLAMGFACGSCKSVFCPNIDCEALLPGGACRYPLKARPSMEAVGINAYAMAARIGWDIYPVGVSISPDEVPSGSALGLVLIY